MRAAECPPAEAPERTRPWSEWPRRHECATALAHAGRQKVFYGALAVPFTGLRRHGAGQHVTFMSAPSDIIVVI